MRRAGGAVLLAIGVVLGAVAAFMAFKPVENYLGQSCGSPFAPESSLGDEEGENIIDDASFSLLCPDALSSGTAWSWILLAIAVVALIIGVVLISLPAAVPVTRRPAPERPSPAAVPSGIADQLQKLQSLHASGALSDDEFVTAKARVLNADDISTDRP